MTRPAAKGKTLWPALVVAAALLLTAPQAFASRTAATRPELLPGRALESPATTAALGPAYSPQGFELHASTDPHPRHHALFPALTPPPVAVEPEKLASGPPSWELAPNLQRIQVFVAESWQVRENLGPVDSPNLYQAFGLDLQNNTDPYGFSIWDDLVEATKFIGGMYLGAAKHAVTAIPKTVEAVVSLVPTKAVDAYYAASTVVAGYQAHGVEGAARAYANEVKQTASDVAQMIPFVAAIQEAQCVDQTIARAGAFAGGMQTGALVDQVRLEGGTLLMAASSLKATPRASAAEPVAADLNEVSEGLKGQWKGAAPKSAGDFIGPRLRGGGTSLAQEGEDLFVGTYSRSARMNRKLAAQLGKDTSEFTPHHVAQDAISPVSHSQGVTINLRKSLHRLTRTFSNPTVDRGASLRTHLARDVWDIRRILLDAGYDPVTVRTQLWELIRQNKALWSSLGH